MKIFKFFRRNLIGYQKTEKIIKDKSNQYQNFDSQVIRLTENSFTKLLDIPIPESDQFKMIKVYIKAGEYFKANQTIFSLGSEIHGSGTLHINFPFGGKVNSYLINNNNSIRLNQELVKIKKIKDTNLLYQKIFEQNLLRLNKTEVSYLEDEFTNCKTIKVTKLANENTEYFKLYLDKSKSINDFLGFTLVNQNGYIYISFNSSNEDITLSKGDRLIMLFDDESKLDITFSRAGEGTKGSRFNNSEIGFEEINTLFHKKLLKIKIISFRKKMFSVYHMDHLINNNQIYSYYKEPLYQTILDGQYLLRIMVEKFIIANQKYKITTTKTV
ncbi:hypothetical protein [uncultured Polaribacter sp.]|uniref:hypothetical protein n=1 Tax=uncultured Polaribacter sp. TaxID=174711 RepID=UPI002617D907|nr:hypothetical protein [uncultured Polaribacter sp.]